MNTRKMKAIVATSYGGPEVLELQDVAMPTPKANEVLVRIDASSVTTAGAMMRTGIPYIGRLFMGFSKPKHPVTGTGFAGEIIDAGKDVTKFIVGEFVFGESIFGSGTNAEYLCIAEDGIIATLPENISTAAAAPICDGALTSLNLLREVAGIQSGQKVLIIGASGSLGTAAVQLAKHLGAEVTGVCSTANLELVKSLGADEVIDYKTTDFTKSGKAYDIIYDTVGKSSFGKSKSSLTPNGTYLSPVLGLPLLFQMLRTSLFGKKKAKFDATGMKPVPELRKMLLELREIIAVGKLKTVIDRQYSLAEVPDAHRYIDKGHKKGNVVITMG
ncbi:MAG: NAD(P)-dependent alcohol dehydrogenase [Lewinella sp.]|uniref:NAD(P)-dependent alcohol dehydrogenase n=1 Tax=Lewinella sp. TaxID=2004506 RepID=UPI003D6B465F